MTLYLKHRPQTLDEIYGNKETVESLKSTLSKEDKPHSFLFFGESGCGKTTLGRIVAKKLGCKGSDFREIDSADFRGIDTIREMRKNSQFKPLEGSCRVWLLDECHKLSNDAMNALLKALEDTPAHIYYILCTTDPQKLLKTIRGRCTQYQVNPLIEKEMLRLLRSITKAENVSINKEIYDKIIESSQGHPRNAIQILEKVLSVPEEQQLSIAGQSVEIAEQSIELCRALVKGESWGKISTILKDLKQEDSEKIRRQIVGYCQSILLNGRNDQAARIIDYCSEPLYNIGFPGLVLACYKILFEE